MNVNYDNTELIAEVKQDIQEFGREMKVYAVYSVFRKSTNRSSLTMFMPKNLNGTNT